MTLDTNVLKNIFLMHTKQKTIISSVPMRYAYCHNVYKFPLKKNTYVDEYYHIDI